MAFCSFIFKVAYKASEDVGEFGRDFVGWKGSLQWLDPIIAVVQQAIFAVWFTSPNKRGISEAWFVVP